MNFIAHYFLDRTNPESLFALGAATPDLLSIYNPTFRIKKAHTRHLLGKQLSSSEAMLLSGIERHFSADAAFHTSAFFRQETGEIIRLLEEHFPGDMAPRKYFVAHVLLELLLDKVLIQEHPEVLDEYYEHYNRNAPFEAVRIATEHLAGRELPHYEDFLSKFQKNRWLASYQKWEHITYVLSRILRRVHITTTGYLDTPAFLSLMQHYEHRLTLNYPRMFDEMHTRLA